MAPISILFHYQPDPQLTSRLEALKADGLAVTAIAPDDREGLERALPGTDIIWHVLEPLRAEDIDAAPRLRLIQKIGVGVNTIDLDAARRRGIPVCNMPGTNSRAVAEMTLALMLAALRRLPQRDTATRAGRGWEATIQSQTGLGEIAGRRVGLVGFGAVPAILAPILNAMGARTSYWSRTPKDGAPATFLPLDRLIETSDILSLHLPLTPETAGLIDEAALARMPAGAVLVNTARGGLVDEAALVRALQSGRLRAAGLDTFADEPLSAGHPLAALPNVAMTPHLAWLTPETMERSLAVACENCRRLAAGEPLLHRVL